ncbi:MAG: bifunctional diaminohydroxyphosphoribosylaminopyrimidine deaminase/5-amino-6-(5-phosphoribosylamino)uracil reductase RibD [Bosea sp. (in: a-proteobacteria)]
MAPESHPVCLLARLPPKMAERPVPGALPAASPEEDHAFMAHALALSRRGLGRTWPNPSVGAVIVNGQPGQRRIVGRGFTQAGGRPHGEAVAFDQAGEAALGGTLYVALEPCSHRTVRGGMPCLERALRAGVRRVVSAIVDPNPEIAGLGHAILKLAGCEVTVGVGGEEAARINRGHILRVTQGRPMVTLKIARTADGYAGALKGGNGARLQVSCEQAGRFVHLQRAMHDAIMVGISTVLADDPQLNVRSPGLEDRSPIRLVLDSHLRLPVGAKLVTTARDIPTWVIASERAPLDAERRLVAAGVEVMRVSAGKDGRLDLGDALQLLATRGITRVFSEGGPTVAAELAQAGLADEILISTSPDNLGEAGVIGVQSALAAALGDASRYRHMGDEMIGVDVLQRYERVM